MRGTNYSREKNRLDFKLILLRPTAIIVTNFTRGECNKAERFDSPKSIPRCVLVKLGLHKTRRVTAPNKHRTEVGG